MAHAGAVPKTQHSVVSPSFPLDEPSRTRRHSRQTSSPRAHRSQPRESHVRYSRRAWRRHVKMRVATFGCGERSWEARSDVKMRGETLRCKERRLPDCIRDQARCVEGQVVALKREQVALQVGHGRVRIYACRHARDCRDCVCTDIALRVYRV